MGRPAERRAALALGVRGEGRPRESIPVCSPFVRQVLANSEGIGVHPRFLRSAHVRPLHNPPPALCPLSGVAEVRGCAHSRRPASVLDAGSVEVIGSCADRTLEKDLMGWEERELKPGSCATVMPSRPVLGWLNQRDEGKSVSPIQALRTRNLGQSPDGFSVGDVLQPVRSPNRHSVEGRQWVRP